MSVRDPVRVRNPGILLTTVVIGFIALIVIGASDWLPRIAAHWPLK